MKTFLLVIQYILTTFAILFFSAWILEGSIFSESTIRMRVFACTIALFIFVIKAIIETARKD